MGMKSVDEAVENIIDWYKDHHNIEPIGFDIKFLKSILEDVDSKSWQEGYDNAIDDHEIYN